jgi:hypothetical protein
VLRQTAAHVPVLTHVVTLAVAISAIVRKLAAIPALLPVLTHVVSLAVAISASVRKLTAIPALLLVLVHAAKPAAHNKIAVPVTNEKNVAKHTQNVNVAREIAASYL